MSDELKPTEKQVHDAAIRWCGAKDRETFMDDIRYFEQNWHALSGLRSYVEREVARSTGKETR